MTELQRLLLHACFGGGIRAWETWREAVDIDRLDRHSQWLLPLLYRRLYALRVEHPLLQRYKNVYLHNWYKNLLLLNALRAVVVEMASIPCVAKAGLGCVMNFYADVGVRPLHSAELCVPAGQWSTLCTRLVHSALKSSIEFCPHPSSTLVVHTKAHVAITLTTADDGLPAGWWQRLEHTTFQDCPCTQLNAADTLTYMLAERTRWDERSDLLWWADILRFVQTRSQPMEELTALTHPFLREG